MPQWLDVPGYPHLQASDEGEIFDTNKGRIKKQQTAGNGARQIKVGNTIRMVHDLVARAFHGHPTVRGYRVKQLNGDRADNRPENLVWAGAPVYDIPTPSDYDIQLEHEYEKIRTETMSLIELMQS